MNILTQGNSWVIAASRSLVGGILLSVSAGIGAYQSAAVLSDASLASTIAIGVIVGVQTFCSFGVIRLGFEGYLDRRNPDAVATEPRFASKRGRTKTSTKRKTSR